MESVKIRPVVLEDAKEILSIYTPFIQNTPVSFEWEVPSLEDFVKRIQTISADYPYFVAELDGKVVGYIYASRFRTREAYNWIVETSVYINPLYHNKGIGRQLYHVLEEALTRQHVHRMYACITTPNRNSVIFHEKAGFTMMGVFPHAGFKLGSWHDISFMEKVLIEDNGTPDSLISYSNLI